MKQGPVPGPSLKSNDRNEVSVMEVSHRKAITLVAVLAIAVSAVWYVADKNGGSLDFSDTEVRVVVSASMDGEPRSGYDIESIPVGSMVFIRHGGSDSFYSSLEVGDVLTFHYKNPATREDMVVTHRIIAISSGPSGYTYTMAGDAIVDRSPSSPSTQTVTSASGDIIGKVTGVSPTLGSLVEVFSTFAGKVLLVVIPCSILAVSGIWDIVKTRRGKGSDGVRGSIEGDKEE